MQPDRVYDGILTGGSLIIANSGTPGIQIFIEYKEDGFIEKTSTCWWLTNKTVDRVKETLSSLGIDAKNLVSETFLDNIGNALVGIEVTFTTVEETYKDETRVKVQWVNPRSKARSGDGAARAVARLFGAPEKVTVPDDGDIPF